MSYKKDIQNCKDYLAKIDEYIGEMHKLKIIKSDTTDTTWGDGMPRGNSIGNRTMKEAINNVDIDNRIKSIQRKINKRKKNVQRVLDRYDAEEKLMRDIIEGLYIHSKPISQVQREIKASNDTFPMLLTQSYKTYTYYFYRSKKVARRE